MCIHLCTYRSVNENYELIFFILLIFPPSVNTITISVIKIYNSLASSHRGAYFGRVISREF